MTGDSGEEQLQRIRSLLLAEQLVPGDDSAVVPFGMVDELRLGTTVLAMMAAPLRLILILSSGSYGYVQFLAPRDGDTLYSECVSNEFLPAPHALSPDDEDRLATLGWNWPSPPERPNWHQADSGEGAVLDATARALTTLRGSFGVDDAHAVRVKLFRSTRE